jgi:hypothetical protein
VKTLGIVLVLAATMVAVFAGSAEAAYVHTNVTGEYGKEGNAKLGGVGTGCRLAYQSANHRLYLYSDNKIYGLNRTAPGTVSTIPGFPVEANLGKDGCNDRDFDVDNTNGASKNNLYPTPSTEFLYAFNASGVQLGSPWPVNTGGETCGVAITNTGEVWGGNYGQTAISKYNADGTPAGTFPVPSRVCKLAVDRTNNDLFTVNYGGGGLTKYTASSGYATSISLGTTNDGNAGLALNGAQNRLYVATGQSVKALDTDSGSVVETIDTSPNNATDVAVDEATDTVFITVGGGSSGYIQERPGIVVPDLAIGDPSGFATLHGHLDPAGGGEVTSCSFEYSTSPEFFGASTTPCAEGQSYSSPADVSADLTGLVTGEVTYYVRLKAGNANGFNRSGSKAVTPHYVAGLHTDPATGIDRTSATLHGSYLGQGEETHIYFKYGTSTSYGATTPVQDIPGNAVTNSISALLNESLAPQTVYHFNVVASNGKGTSEGEDATFETLPAVAGISTDAATNIKTATADLNGSFTGDGLNVKYYFEWGSSTLYGNETAVGEITAPSGPTSVSPVGIEELQPLHTYHFRIVAENSFGITKGPDQTFTTFTAPVIVSQSTTKVTGTSGDLHAVINPHGVEAEYHFEYGPTDSYGTTVPIPDGTIPPSNTDETITQHLEGLNGGVYHFRIKAKNIYGESVSKDQTFNFYPPVCPNATVRQQTGANEVPDCRAYELVSPEDAGITQLFPANVPFSPGATQPSRLAFVGAFGSPSGAGETINNVGDTYFATRTNTGWKTKYIGLPATKTFLSGGPPWDYGGYPPGWVQGYTGDHWTMNEVVNPDMSELVAWDDGYIGPGETYDSANYAGSSMAPYVWDTTNGKQRDRWPTNVEAIPGGEEFKGRTFVSKDLSHFVFTSNIPFAPGGQPGDMYDNNTKEASIEIINFDEEGNRISVSPVEASTDGTHILMTSKNAEKQPGWFTLTNGSGELFMRIDGQTFDIADGHNVKYVDMTPDGTKVYFTSKEDLTEDASDPDTSRDLYMWSEESSAPNHLTLVSKGNEPFAGNTDSCSASWTSQCDIKPIEFTEEYSILQGGIGGGPYSDNTIAPNNGDIYFLSPERLAGNNGVDGEENLFVYHGGKLKFVAALEPSGVACLEQQFAFYCSVTAVARLQTTPNDEFMAFVTGSKVTAYDNQGHAEMYRYTPDTEELICVSCKLNGKPPTGEVTGSHNGRYMTDDGRTFFETEDALVSQDTNEARDVYEYVDGRPQLITGGTAASNEIFGIGTVMAKPGLIGVSSNGLDVFFSTFDTLVGQDRNGESLKVYDARSGGGFQFTPPVPPCVAADECHGASSEAPSTAPSGTGAELGAGGNLEPQHHGKKQQKKAKRKRHSKSKKKRHGSAQRKGGRNG